MLLLLLLLKNRVETMDNLFCGWSGDRGWLRLRLTRIRARRARVGGCCTTLWLWRRWGGASHRRAGRRGGTVAGFVCSRASRAATLVSSTYTRRRVAGLLTALPPFRPVVPFTLLSFVSTTLFARRGGRGPRPRRPPCRARRDGGVSTTTIRAASRRVLVIRPVPQPPTLPFLFHHLLRFTVIVPTLTRTVTLASRATAAVARAGDAAAALFRPSRGALGATHIGVRIAAQM